MLMEDRNDQSPPPISPVITNKAASTYNLVYFNVARMMNWPVQGGAQEKELFVIIKHYKSVSMHPAKYKKARRGGFASGRGANTVGSRRWIVT